MSYKRYNNPEMQMNIFEYAKYLEYRKTYKLKLSFQEYKKNHRKHKMVLVYKRASIGPSTTIIPSRWT